MSTVRVRPAVASGRHRAPPSKSYTHRALVTGHLADRPFRIDRPLDSEDTRATARAIALLGTHVERRPHHWALRPAAARRRSTDVVIDCGESGTTLRFIAALAARESRSVTLEGRGRLPRRPMERLLGALRGLGATCRCAHPYGGLPLTVRGPIHAGRVAIDASESSQFASALLFVLPTLSGESEIRLTGRIVSRPYLEATLAVLRHHGLRLGRRGRRIRVPGEQRYTGRRFGVPGDASSAAYFWSAAAVTGGRVRIDGLPGAWPQADLAILSVLDRAGAVVERTPSGAVVSGGRLRPFSVDLTDAPDLYPLVGVLAAATPGRSVIRGAAHVALKESDRRGETVRLVTAFGARPRSLGSGLAIEGSTRLRPVALRGLSDHRLVMSAAVGALAADGPSTIGDGRAVRKSFPGFWEALGRVASGSIGA